MSAHSGIEGDVSIGNLHTVMQDIPEGDGDRSLGDMPTMMGGGARSDAGLQHEPLGYRYELHDEIGRGGFAVVYKATDKKLGRTVAIKKLLKDSDEVEYQTLERFKREARVIAGLNHRNVVGVYDVGEDDDGIYLVMEYVEGGSLRDLLKEKGKLPLPEAISYLRGMVQGLSYAHRKNLVHRDIKPANILLQDESGELIPKIVDFGLAQAGRDSELSMSGYGMGTPWYMPPEQRRDAKNVNHTADIYALGKTFYEMVTGEIPDNVDPGEIPPPPKLSEIIFKCIKSKPEERFFSADELYQALDELVGVASVIKGATRGASGENDCPACGSENPKDVKFCEQCGGGLIVNCPECDRENSIHKQFCGGCGTDVEGFSSSVDILQRMEGYGKEKKWSRVVKEYALFKPDTRLPGTKGADLRVQIESMNKTAQAVLDKLKAMHEKIALQADDASLYEGTIELIAEYQSIDPKNSTINALEGRILGAIEDRDFVAREKRAAAMVLEGNYEAAIERYLEFLEKHPEGKHAPSVREQVEQVLPIKIDERDYGIARKSAHTAEENETFEESIQLYSKYINDHPSGCFVEQAREQVDNVLPLRIANREYELTRGQVQRLREQADGEAAWGEKIKLLEEAHGFCGTFCARFAGHKNVPVIQFLQQEVVATLENARDEQAFEHAVQKATPLIRTQKYEQAQKFYRLYLEQHGVHAAEASTMVDGELPRLIKEREAARLRLKRKRQRRIAAAATVAILICIGVFTADQIILRNRIQAFKFAVVAKQKADAVEIGSRIEARYDTKPELDLLDKYFARQEMYVQTVGDNFHTLQRYGGDDWVDAMKSVDVAKATNDLQVGVSEYDSAIASVNLIRNRVNNVLSAEQKWLDALSALPPASASYGRSATVSRGDLERYCSKEWQQVQATVNKALATNNPNAGITYYGEAVSLLSRALVVAEPRVRAKLEFEKFRRTAGAEADFRKYANDEWNAFLEAERKIAGAQEDEVVKAYGTAQNALKMAVDELKAQKGFEQEAIAARDAWNKDIASGSFKNDLGVIKEFNNAGWLQANARAKEAGTYLASKRFVEARTEYMAASGMLEGIQKQALERKYEAAYQASLAAFDKAYDARKWDAAYSALKQADGSGYPNLTESRWRKQKLDSLLRPMQEAEKKYAAALARYDTTLFSRHFSSEYNEVKTCAQQAKILNDPARRSPTLYLEAIQKLDQLQYKLLCAQTKTEMDRGSWGLAQDRCNEALSVLSVSDKSVANSLKTRIDSVYGSYHIAKTTFQKEKNNLGVSQKKKMEKYAEWDALVALERKGGNSSDINGGEQAYRDATKLLDTMNVLVRLDEIDDEVDAFVAKGKKFDGDARKWVETEIKKAVGNRSETSNMNRKIASINKTVERNKWSMLGNRTRLPVP
jgi:serine/threonine protein kinase